MKSTATCFLIAGTHHRNSRPLSGRLSFYGLPAIADCCTIKLGGDWEKVYCRGYWDNLLLHDDGTVSFSVESAWGELYDVRKFIEEQFPGVRLYFQCEEPGMCIYQTNDDTGDYFPEKYYLWGEDGETEYYTTIEALAKEVENITGSKNLKTFDSCKKALETYSRSHSDLCYTLEEFELLDD